MGMVGRVYFLDSEADPRDRLGLGKRRKAERSYWRVLCHGRPMDRGPRRNVLVENVESGELMVRPFRGFRRLVDGGQG